MIRMNVAWKGKMSFEARAKDETYFLMDAYPSVGGENCGPSPLEALLGSVAACSGMDVISILQKKRQKVTGYRMEVEGERADEGDYPKPFTKITLRHYLSGIDLDKGAVERAVQLSDDKYCSVIATLRVPTEIESEWKIE